jgi:hypothetical protein
LFFSQPWRLLVFVFGKVRKAIPHRSAQLDESRRLAALTALPQIRVTQLEHLGGGPGIHQDVCWQGCKGGVSRHFEADPAAFVTACYCRSPIMIKPSKKVRNP